MPSIGQFINAFPPSMAEKLTSIECGGYGKDQLEGLLQKVETMRMKAQRKDIHNLLNPQQVHPTAGKKAHVVQKEKVEILQIIGITSTKSLVCISLGHCDMPIDQWPLSISIMISCRSESSKY